MDKQTQNLPTVAELFSDNIETAFQNEKLNLLLNQEPNQKWIKIHPYIQGYKYLPIDKIEFMLGYIFKRFSIEVLKTGMLLNSVEVTVRVHFLNPVTNTMEHHDGVGACEIQTNKDTGSLKMDMSNVSRGAVAMALPIAKTVAIKDACDHFGKLFGRDLNRKDAIVYSADSTIMNSQETQPQIDQEIQDSLDLMTDLDTLDKYVLQLVTADKKLHRDTGFRNAVEKTKQRLKPKN